MILQIANLKEGEKYVFRVRAQNKAGVGKTSEVTDPVPALTKPGKMSEAGTRRKVLQELLMTWLIINIISLLVSS